MKTQARTWTLASAALLLCVSCGANSDGSAPDRALDGAIPVQALVGLILPTSQLDEPETGPQLAPGQYAVNSFDSVSGASTSSQFCADGSNTGEVLMNIQTLSLSHNCFVDQYARDGSAFDVVVYCRTPAGGDRWSKLKGDIASNTASFSVLVSGTGLSRDGKRYTSRARRTGDCS